MTEPSFPANCDKALREDAETEVLEGELVEPREGSLDWLATLPTVTIEGLGDIPARHRLKLDEGGQIKLGEDDGWCRYIRPDGRRCGAPRIIQYGVCLVHAGGGQADLAAMGRKGAEVQARLKISRQLLGVHGGRAADPRQLLRVRAHERAEALASAALAPLDDEQLSALARHGAALRILDATFPQEQVTVSVDLPADEAGVEALSWQDMQRLAAQLLSPTTGHSEGTAELEGA